MTEFISRKYGNEGYEIIIKTDNHEHYKASEEFARRLIDHAKPVTDNNVGSKWIPVSERLPDWRDGKVLVFTKYGFSICERTVNGRWKGQHANWITHWMPLPEPPKEEMNNG
jgi:hypothetical protein